MKPTCTKCGAPDKEWVCNRLDGSNMFALDLDLHTEQPATWGYPHSVRILPSGVCTNCHRDRLVDLAAYKAE